MENLGSVFIYREREQELKQKLVDATQELETMKTVETKLFNLLNKAYQERDEAKCQLQKFMNNKLTTSHDMFLSGINQESLLILPSTKSITESSSLSHGSPPVDSYFDTVSSPEFSNNNNIGNCFNQQQQQQQHLVQDFISLPMSDPGTAVIDCLAKERSLPQKGKLFQAVIDAGPLLQTMLLAGPLPTWKNPPLPLQQNLKVPPLTIKPYNTNNTPSNSSIIEPNVAFASTCSASMLNFAAQHPSTSWNNSWQFNNFGSSSVKIQAPPRKRQRHQ